MTARMRIAIRDLRLEMEVGIHPAEHGRRQTVIVNLEADVAMPAEPLSDAMADWVSYETAVADIRALAAAGHVRLLETFALRIAEKLTRDARLSRLHLRLDKTQAIDGTASVGVMLDQDFAG